MTEFNYQTHGVHIRLADAAYLEIADLQQTELNDEYEIRPGYNHNGDVVHIFVDRTSGEIFVAARGTDQVDDALQYDEIGRGDVTELGAATATVAEAEFQRSGQQVTVVGHSLGGHAAEEAARYSPHAVSSATNVQGPSVIDEGEEADLLMESTYLNPDPALAKYQAIAEAQRSDPQYQPPENITRISASEYELNRWGLLTALGKFQFILDGTGTSIFPPDNISIPVGLHSSGRALDYVNELLKEAADDLGCPTFGDEGYGIDPRSVVKSTGGEVGYRDN